VERESPHQMVETSEGEVCKQCLQPHIDGSREHFTQGGEGLWVGGGGAVFHLKIHTQFHLKDNSHKAKNERNGKYSWYSRALLHTVYVKYLNGFRTSL
jgi:hypothetical protein